MNGAQVPLDVLLIPLDDLEKSTPISEVETRLRMVRDSLNGSDPLRREAVRLGAIEKLKAAEITGAAKLVQAALADSDSHIRGQGAGRPVVFEDPTPWPQPVDGAALLDDIAAVYRRFVVLPPGGEDVLALWIVFTYCIDAFDIAPMLAVTSPTMRCGKTRTLEISSALAHRPLSTSNITGAAMFRMVEMYAPTLIVDEVDTFLKDNQEMAGIFNSGHTRTAAYVVRVVGDEHEPRQFSTWGAKMIACIGRLPFPTMADRSIILELRRRATSETVDRMRRSRLHDDLATMRQRLVRWAADHLLALKEAESTPLSGLNDRQEDNFRCLLTIADAAGGRWPQRARQLALLLSGVEAGEPMAPVMLLADIRSLFGEQKVVSTDVMLDGLLKLEERPWPTWNRGKPMTARHLAVLLRPFGLRSRSVRIGDATPKGYTLSDFKDSFDRYLSDFESATTQQVSGDEQLPINWHPPHDGGVAGEKSDLSPDGERNVADVADEKLESRGMTIYEL